MLTTRTRAIPSRIHTKHGVLRICNLHTGCSLGLVCNLELGLHFCTGGSTIRWGAYYKNQSNSIPHSHQEQLRCSILRNVISAPCHLMFLTRILFPSTFRHRRISLLAMACGADCGCALALESFACLTSSHCPTSQACVSWRPS